MNRRPGGEPSLDPFQARLMDDLMRFVEGRSSREPAAPKRPSIRRRRRRALFVAVAVLLVSAAAATAVVLTRPDAQVVAAAGIACADRVAERPDLAIVVADGRSPVEVCAGLWRNGQIVSGSRGEPPELTACVSETGAVFVFPSGPAVCDKLGMTRGLPADYSPVAATLAGFRRALASRLEPAGGACPPIAEAAAIAEDELHRFGLRGWSVTVDDGGSGECASFGLDAQARTVVVSRIPG